MPSEFSHRDRKWLEFEFSQLKLIVAFENQNLKPSFIQSNEDVKDFETRP
jgi:hypothetical protein